jgi:hypothetical protein
MNKGSGGGEGHLELAKAEGDGVLDGGDVRVKILPAEREGSRELAARRSNVSRSMNKLDPLFGESVPSPLPLIIF